jgi:protoporphyrinogen oxidase
MNSQRFAVIGSGPMGLMAAIELLDRGHAVDVHERDDRIGGMSASFDFSGTRIERYYHFICKTDYPLFDLLKRFGIGDKLHWTDTKMGYFYNGKLHKWGTPLALLAFPHLGPISKVRYALHVLHTKGIQDWSALDGQEAGVWIRKWIGAKAYKVMWEDAFRLKFFEYKDNLSASWIGTRIKRVALSRRSLMHESLGYLEGGSSALLERMAQDIVSRGGRILLSSGISEVVSDGGKVTGVRTMAGFEPYHAVLSTAPIQYVPGMVPGLPASFSARIRAIENIPVACVILKLKHSISDNFWMNISDPEIAIPGVIEYSNLNPGTGETILYAPFYMPKTQPKWQWSNQALINEVLGYLPRLNPGFAPDWVLASHCHRYEFAQTICPPGFQQMLPPMKTPLTGFYMADTAYYYPEDRSISESVAVGTALARAAMTEAT